ncbi:MAG: DUF305 domain-containing protein [Microbacteriaceae bacterium]
MAPARSRSPRVLIAGLVATVLIAGGSFAVGRLSAPVASPPSTTSAEAGFTRDMREHHLQAVEMSMTVRDLTDDPEIRLLAFDIAMTQQSQAGQMLGWLAEWQLPTTSSEPSMTWMTRPTLDGGGDDGSGDDGSGAHQHDAAPTTPAHTPGSLMPGMATMQQLTDLRALTGVAAEKEFLTLMIAHHQGGVDMAEAVLHRSDERVVTQLATGIVASQTAEITLMKNLLAARS